MNKERTEVIFGATSRIAREYINFLVNKGVPVLLFSRSGERSQFPDSKLVLGHVQHDFTSEDWSGVVRALHGVKNPRLVYLATRGNVQLRHNSHGGTRAEYNHVNVFPLLKLIDFAKEMRGRVVYTSTDLVYGGDKESFSEDAAPQHPWGFYGHSKRDGELAVLGHEEGTLVRLPNVLGMRRDFVSNIAFELNRQKMLPESEQQSVEAWDNVENRFVGIHDVCYVLDRSASYVGDRRIFHVASPDEPVSRYAIVSDFVNLYNKSHPNDTLPINLLRSVSHNFRDGRPKRLKLETRLTELALGFSPTPIDKALDESMGNGYPYLETGDFGK